MKKVIKLVLLAIVLCCTACSTTRQAQAEISETPSYKLPACHHAIHQKMLLEQKRYINAL